MRIENSLGMNHGKVWVRFWFPSKYLVHKFLVEFLYSFKFLCHGKYIKNQNQNLMEIGFHLGPLYNIKTILQYVVEWHSSH